MLAEVAKEENKDRFPTLRSALLAISRDTKLPSQNQVKFAIRGMKRTPINGMRFESVGVYRVLQMSWVVVSF